MLQFYCYPKCTTCQKAKKWLDTHGVPYEEIHIVEQHPDAQTLREFYQKSGLPLSKFFNTSGMKYREMGLKDVVKSGSEEELLALLASDGMLVKRPLVTDGSRVTLGFREDEYAENWLK